MCMSMGLRFRGAGMPCGMGMPYICGPVACTGRMRKANREEAREAHWQRILTYAGA